MKAAVAIFLAVSKLAFQALNLVFRAFAAARSNRLQAHVEIDELPACLAGLRLGRVCLAEGNLRLQLFILLQGR